MFRTFLLVAAVALALQGMIGDILPGASAQRGIERATKKSAVVTPRTSISEHIKEKLTKLEKEEEEIDKELKEEIAKRKNNSIAAAAAAAAGAGDGASVTPIGGVEDPGAEQLCNNALQVDFTRPGSVTLCRCGVREVLSNGTCVPYDKDLTVLSEKNIVFKEDLPITHFRVRVNELDCSNKAQHRQMEFDNGTFYQRMRGDVVLTKSADHLVGLRINEYCLNYILDDDGQLALKMKACVPHPIVPRCCPANHILRNGTCVTGPSPEYLNPEIQADPRGGNPVEWPLIRNQVHPMTCAAGEILRSVTLDVNGSFLLALANGLAYRWYTNGPNGRSEFKFCPDFCVDGRQSIDGAMEYFVNFCYVPPEERQPETCQSEACIRKCCKPGEIMSVDHYRCLRFKDEKFDPPVTESLKHYEIAIGRPLCAIHVADVNQTQVDAKGNWVVGADSLSSNEYCMDTFAIRGKKTTMALMCWGGYDVSAWLKARMIIFPVCHIISLIFLVITVAFYLLAPVLLKQGGWHQLAYVLSLMLAFISTVSLNFYHTRLSPTGCVVVALVMQFGFLSTFFWLCVMCFDIENKIRSLKEFRAYMPLHSMAYLAFGLGGPVLIGLITLIVHATVPFGTPGVIVPAIGITRCWFHGEWELLAYFYGPIAILFLLNIGLIASTAYNYLQIEKGALGLAMKAKNESGQPNQPPIEYDREKQTRKNFAEFKHKFLLLSLMFFCWTTELLSWRIPPPEIWALTDILNSLQGVFIFIIFLTNRRNRKVLKNKHPRLYSIYSRTKDLFRKVTGIRKKRKTTSEEGAEREPSISSEYSELSENCKSNDPTAT